MKYFVAFSVVTVLCSVFTQGEINLLKVVAVLIGTVLALFLFLVLGVFLCDGICKLKDYFLLCLGKMPVDTEQAQKNCLNMFQMAERDFNHKLISRSQFVFLMEMIGWHSKGYKNPEYRNFLKHKNIRADFRYSCNYVYACMCDYFFHLDIEASYNAAAKPVSYIPVARQLSAGKVLSV